MPFAVSSKGFERKSSMVGSMMQCIPGGVNCPPFSSNSSSCGTTAVNMGA